MARTFEFPIYALVGLCATGAHYLTLMLIVELRLASAATAAMAGALLGANLAYAGHRLFTFPATNRSHAAGMPRFLSVAAMGVAISGSSVRIGVDLLGLHYMPSQMVGTLLTLLSTYHCNRAWTFI